MWPFKDYKAECEQWLKRYGELEDEAARVWGENKDLKKRIAEPPEKPKPGQLNPQAAAYGAYYTRKGLEKSEEVNNKLADENYKLKEENAYLIVQAAELRKKLFTAQERIGNLEQDALEEAHRISEES
jgi:hypothetical protein